MRDIIGSEEDFADFYGARGVELRRSAYLIVNDWHRAEDLTQQAMAKVYARWRRVRPETRMAYARRAVINECLSYLRRHRPEVPTRQVPEIASDSDPSSSSLDLRATLTTLPAQQRAIVALRYLDDLSVREVAHLLGIAEGTVKSQSARALATLRTHHPHLVPATTHLKDDR